MSAEWYVLHTRTGAELDVQQHLKRHSIDSVVLRETAIIRRSGRWREEIRNLFPGYVFLFINYTPDMFHVLKATPSAIRLLPKGKPMPLIRDDCAWLLMCADDEILPPSKVDFSGEAPIIIDGPLAIFEHYILKYYRRHRKAMLRIPVLGESKNITLSIIPV